MLLWMICALPGCRLNPWCSRGSGWVLRELWGAASAAVHECGDLNPVPCRLITSERRQTQRTDIVYSRRQLNSRDVVVLGGLPVTNLERTVADLVDEIGDLSLVGDVPADAVREKERSTVNTSAFC